MVENKLTLRLSAFQTENKIVNKGALSVVLHVSRYAKKNGLPLVPENLITEGSGQVLYLGKASVQGVLKDYGITQVLAEEGGRTSRGSIGYMFTYVAFLNQLQIEGIADLAKIEAWWVDRVREYFLSKPFHLKFDASKGLQAVIQDLFLQAKKRQQQATGTMYQGAMLQHLVGAKLELALPGLQIQQNGSSVADAVSDRSGDFVIDDTVIHTTTAPGEALLRKCKINLESGKKPIIITLGDGIATAKGLASYIDLTGRVDILDAEQFIAANIHELSLFSASERLPTIEKLIEAYNRIIDENETDPSLKIELG
jgi:hypothetical protein